MPLFDVRVVQAVWETSLHRVEADDAEEAKAAVLAGEQQEVLWTSIGDAVSGFDAEVESVDEVEGGR